jgi:aryl-alcohol dehydrogenase-like predicted oxidoreductase
MDDQRVTRRDALRIGLGAGAAFAMNGCTRQTAGTTAPPPVPRAPAGNPLIQKAIPSSGEKLAVVGIGTRDFGTNYNPEARAALREMLKQFPGLGGSVIDTAPSYNNSEAIIGELTNELGIRPKLFLANKVNAGPAADVPTEVRSQFETGLTRLRTDKLDLLQIHNLAAVEQSLPLLREWKQAGRIRYLGITTSSENQYPAMATIMRAQQLDFVQVDYAINSREAADVILPLAKERGMAVLINLPFGRNSAFTKTTGKPVPDWAKEIGCSTWPQVLLKYVVSHAAVTAAIPGTRKVEHITDNLVAAHGVLPDATSTPTIASDGSGVSGS